MIIQNFNPLEDEMVTILDKEGEVVREDILPDIEDDKLKHMYKTMLFTRIIDTKTLQYQRQGRMLTYAPNKGQEAAQIGSVAAIEKEDWLVPAFRELGAWLYKGVSLDQIYLYWYGNEEGSRFEKDVKVLPISVPIASQLNHAVGIAMATNIKKENDVTLAYVGDGGTSEGEFHEALNFAGVFNTPNVFIIQNNQWAISVSRNIQTKSETLAQKAIAYGIPGVQVDGNDVLAMYAVTKEAVERARRGEGPTLIEAVTYRLGPHTTSDDPTIYRTNEEVEEWALKDPLTRFQKYLLDKGILTQEEDEKLRDEYADQVTQTFKKIEKTGADTKLIDVFKYNYAEMPPNLKEQYEEQKRYYEGGEK
ncbi:pyruvate dehydrogenase (acetyl-transferring) E1 component subunit alpha [Clostridium sp. D2Q-11]|uniref:Pyruvate dehydrogenase E1 component subunit alpha n=1 Tax=Anaeromonas frigoriresistens TaxID=2683708 RepID=A0A942UR73_9FIRM|nr:pyruvate dehydrogenase (acetyl-transferring) E1 component subunit alpha [Anaeromonas frigoriresistens]MBS4537708.1 pyruvate dehydrogenase (acetyl-transferring) E1 component subunit alpha [Anaeromonas frigoriresistens]